MQFASQIERRLFEDDFSVEIFVDCVPSTGSDKW